MINDHLIVSPLFVKVCEKLQNNIQMFRVWLDFTENTTTGKKRAHNQTQQILGKQVNVFQPLNEFLKSP